MLRTVTPGRRIGVRWTEEAPVVTKTRAKAAK
jgi:hypothetical protein